MKILPVIKSGMIGPITVTMGIRALRITCRIMIALSLSPLARAVRTKSAFKYSITLERV